MACTYGIGSDRYAAVIEKVSPSGAYVLAAFNGKAVKFTRRADGRYVRAGGCGSLTLGIADDYRDPSF